MSDLPAAQRHALEAWASRAIDSGWLASNATASLATLTTSGPAHLFHTDDRPLVAGLFGGTGVGKSTLLNRIAGESIARASAERPTSRGITVYLHRSQLVDRLPDAFPMERMRTAHHNNQQYRHVMFIDMPDFDSVETANRELVDVWLPHLDVVLYVVSPDRYRDDQGWRLLLQHAKEHAWLFVMNHWDRGDPIQIDDFRQQLSGAGLDNPMIFRSDSSEHSEAEQTSPRDDDFNSLCQTLEQLADRSIVKSLNELGILARLKSLKATSDRWLASMGSQESLTTLQKDWQSHWQKTSTELQESLNVKARQLAQHYAVQDGSWLERWRNKPAANTPDSPTNPVIDESLLSRLDDTLSDFLNQQAHASELPLPALKQSVSEPYARARRDFPHLVNDAIARSLATPGTLWQRRLHDGLGQLCLFLPLAAMIWIAWRVVAAFVEGGSNPSAYLGSSFAINGALLLLLAWLIPNFLQRKIKPSQEKAALLGLQQGFKTAMSQASAAIEQGFLQLGEQSDELRRDYNELWQSLSPAQSTELPDTVRRMLASEINNPDAQRSLDVRANTHNSTDAAPLS